MAQNVPGLCLSTRLNMAFVCFLGCIIVYAVRSNISFAIVCMVNSTAIEQSGEDIIEDSNKEGQCVRTGKGNESVEAEEVSDFSSFLKLCSVSQFLKKIRKYFEFRLLILKKNENT